MTDGIETDGQEEAEAAGRARVRSVLLSALSGLHRPRGMRVEDYDALAPALAYMREDALRGLAEYVLRIAGGSPRPVEKPRCPEPGTIRAWAYAIQPPPPRQSDYARSVMRSVLGREALDGGWHVQLFRHLRRFGPPLAMSTWQKDKLRTEAQDDARTLARVRERLQAGQSVPDDRRWLAAWHNDLREAEALIEEGDARRAARAAEGKAA